MIKFGWIEVYCSVSLYCNVSGFNLYILCIKDTKLWKGVLFYYIVAIHMYTLHKNNHVYVITCVFY